MLTRSSLGALGGSICLTLLATGMEGMSYLLLVPTIHALIAGDTSLIRRVPFLERFVDRLPDVILTSDFYLVSFLLGLIFTAALLKNVFEVQFNVNVLSQTNSFLSRLRMLIYERYLSFGKLFFDKRIAGSLQDVLMNHPRQVAHSLKALHQIFYSAIMLAVNLAIMAKISWTLTLLTVVIWPFFNLSVGGLIRQIRQASVLFARANADLARRASNTLSCMPLIKACSAEETERARFESANQLAEKTAAVVAWKQFFIGPIQEIAGLLMIFFIVGLMAHTLADKHSSHAAAYLVFFIVLRRSIAILGNFSRARATFASMRGTLGELEELFSDENKFYVADGTHEFENLKNKISIEGLNFEYPGRAGVLKSVSFEVKKGQMTALVGPTGAGKTTLIHLLMRFYECPKGAIFVDGRDLREFSLKSFHKRVAFISQDPLLFNETIWFNLNYGLEVEVSENDVAKALKQARLYDFIQKLPQKLETQIGDRGIRLSGGEKQRLAIARALLRNAEILILDEATSALDGETEGLIQAALAEAIQGRTTLVVAHRFSTIRHADHIVVLDDGRMVEMGPLQELLEAKGLFSKLWEAQRFY